MIMNRNLISVIVPIFNVEDFIDECIKSILNQDYQNIEIILVNDGSTDRSSSICEYYEKKDNRVKVIHKENGGQGAARNKALDIISGEYVSFVDADDYIEPDMFSSMISMMQLYDADISVCDMSVLTFGRKIDIRKFSEAQVWEKTDVINQYVVSKKIDNSFCNKIFKRDILQGVRFPEVRYKEDAFIMPEVLNKCNRAVHIGCCKYVQRVRINSTERSLFNENKLFALDCAINLQNVIRSSYPEYYKYVEFELIKKYLFLMEDISKSHKYFEHKKLYLNLYNGLKSEIISMNDSNNCIYKKYIEWHWFYLVKWHLSGYLIHLKNCLRKLVNT